MSDESTGKVTVGEILGFRKALNPLRKEARVLIRADGEIITVFVDIRQLKFIRNKYSEGSKVAVGFYGGEWHIGFPPAPSREYTSEPDITEFDLLQKEIGDLDIIGMVGKPEATEYVSDEQVFLDELSSYRQYVELVEQNIKDNSEEILAGMGLAHLNSLKARKTMPYEVEKDAPDKNDRAKQEYLGQLRVVVAQNREIIANQNEIIHLLKKYAEYFNGLTSHDKFN